MQCYSRNIKLQYWLTALLFLFKTVNASAQQPFARELWLGDAGVPIRINALAMDADGYIWVGSDAGLYRYNGSVFETIQDAAKAPVTALGLSSHGVWAGFRNGRIGRAENGRTVLLQDTAGLPQKAITSINSLSPTRAIATTEDQIMMVGDGFKAVSGKEAGLPEGYIYSLTPLAAGRALLASDNGLSDFHYDGGRWQVTSISTAQSLPDPILRVVKPIPNTTLCWLGTQQGGIALYSSAGRTAWVPYYKDNWIWGQVNDILSVSKERAYAVTESGYLLELFLADSLHLTITAHAYPGKVLNKLISDKSGNLWCATDQNLLKISAPYAGYIPLQKPYSLQMLTAMACGRDNKMWLAQDNALYQLNLNDTMQQPRLVANAPSGITTLFADADGRLWVGTLGNGLWYLSPGGKSLAPSGIAALNSENILSIAGTAQHLWVASLSGVYEMSYPDAGNEAFLKHHTKASGIGSDYVYQIYTDSKARVWMATDGAGIAMYDGQRYKRWDGEMGIKVAYAITEDAQGNIWAATLEKGLFCYHAGAWQRFGREAGVQETAISSLTATKSGMIVAVNRQGIDQWYPGSRQFRHYSRRLNIDIDSTSPVLNCITRDNSGNVFVPFEHGIIRLRNDAAQFDIRPAVHISQVALFMSPLSDGQHEFLSDENYLSFFFDGLNYTNPEPLNYRYKLEGYNNNWIQTSDNRVTFPQLPPGTYTFRLQGSLNQHFLKSSEASYSFHIASPLWRRAWFIVLCLLLLGVLARYLIRLRDKSVNNLLRLRQERLLFEYEHLKSQVNPHFLFNSLNTLTGLIEDGENDVAATYTSQLSDLYRNMLAYRDRDLILLSEEWDILAAYLHIQRSRFEDAFQVKVDIPETVLQTKKIVPMALQLLVENAIKHNVMSQSNPLTIHITADEASITVSNQLRPKLSPQKGAGIGQSHIRRRYELLTSRKVSFAREAGFYIVNLPLL